MRLLRDNQSYLIGRGGSLGDLLTILTFS